MFHSVGILFFVIILGIIVVECNARYDTGHAVNDESVMCYDCNSRDDPRCGDPFDPYTIGLVNCSMKKRLNHLPNLKPTFCRKSVQKVQGNVRVIRGCGYYKDKEIGKVCHLRTGTHDVHVLYCSCKGNYCNSGNLQSYPNRIILGAILLAIMRLIQTA